MINIINTNTTNTTNTASTTNTIIIDLVSKSVMILETCITLFASFEFVYIRFNICILVIETCICLMTFNSLQKYHNNYPHNNYTLLESLETGVPNL